MLRVIQKTELLHEEYRASTLITLLYWYRDNQEQDYPDLSVLLSGGDAKSENLYRLFFLSFAKQYEQYEMTYDDATKIFLGNFNELSPQVTNDCVCLLLTEQMCFRLDEYVFNNPVKGVW